MPPGDKYGADDCGAGKTVVLDYSSINIAKRFHIGHLSTTMIGDVPLPALRASLAITPWA